MSPVEIERGLGGLLATQFYGASDPKEVAPQEVAETTDELGNTMPEDSEVATEAEAESDDEAAATDAPDFALDLKVNGAEHRITDRAEAIKLAQLGMHFTQRNEEVLQLRRQVEEREAEATRIRDQYATYLPEIEAYLANPLGDAPKREAFADELSYYKAKDQYVAAQERVQAVKAERQRVMQEQQQQRDAAIARWVRDQDQAILTAIPEWNDPSVMRAETQAMTEYALRAGISQQALQNPLLVRDKAFVAILRDATLYQQLKAQGATEVKRAQSPVAAPGAAKPVGETVNRRRKELETRAKSGKTADVAPAMSQLMGRVLELQNATNNRKPKQR
jgi:hypothetical protein